MSRLDKFLPWAITIAVGILLLLGVISALNTSDNNKQALGCVHKVLESQLTFAKGVSVQNLKKHPEIYEDLDYSLEDIEEYYNGQFALLEPIDQGDCEE